MGGAAERWRLYGLALREAGRRLARAPRRSLRALRLTRSQPDRLLFAPQDLRTSDPTLAQDFYGGLFVFSGRAVETRGSSPFAIDPPSRGWRDALDGFGWLRHLRAADTPLARDNARALVLDAIRRRGRDRLATPVASRRLISFLCQSPLLLTGADHGFYRRFTREIGRLARRLEDDLYSAARPSDRLAAAVALSYAGLCCSGLETPGRRGLRALAAELDRQILPDGFHVSRNPARLVGLLLDLMPLRQVLTSRAIQAPEELGRALDRMLPALRLLRHGDGALALFNGMGRTEPDHLATLLSYDAVGGEPPRHATYSGYARLESGRTLLLCEIGAAPPLAASSEAGAGALSFELSSGPNRIVVNCGTPVGDGPARAAARLTRAHSTVTIGENSSAQMLEPFGFAPERALARRIMRSLGPVILQGPREVTATLSGDGDGATRLAARHDGFLPSHGIVHERRWRLDDGLLAGEDVLVATEGRTVGAITQAMVRFHLHPSAVAICEGERILLTLRGGERWRFSAEGAPPTLEPSVFFAGPEGRRPTVQIVVALPANGRLDWRFERLAE